LSVGAPVIQLVLPLLPLEPMAQLRRGVTQILEAQMHPLAMAIPRFIQLIQPLPPLEPMAQLRRGVTQVLEAQAHPLIKAIPRSIQI
jgi:hypothetical protein